MDDLFNIQFLKNEFNETLSANFTFNHTDLYLSQMNKTKTDNYYLVFIYILIFITGLIGNFIVIYFVLVYKRMQTKTNKFITNLAVADLLVIFICVPVTASRYTTEEWLFGEFMCRFSSFAQGVSLSVSVMTLTAISIDRYYIIYKPMKARSICTNRKVKIIVIATWILSMFLMSPLLIVFKFEKINIPNADDINMCFERWPDFETKLCFEFLLICVLFMFPVLFMSYAYITISKTLWFVKEKNVNTDKALVYQIKKSATNRLNSFRKRNNQSETDDVNKIVVERLNGIDKELEISLLDASSIENNHQHQSRSKSSITKRTGGKRKIEKPLLNKARKYSNSAAVNSLIYQLKIYNSKNSSTRTKSSNLNLKSSLSERNRSCLRATSQLVKTRGNEIAIHKLIRSRRRVVKLLIILVFLFLISWFPYHFMSLLIDFVLYWEHKFGDFTSTSKIHSETTSIMFSIHVYPIALCLALANSATNPVCFITLSHGFRNMFKTAFKRWCIKTH